MYLLMRESAEEAAWVVMCCLLPHHKGGLSQIEFVWQVLLLPDASGDEVAVELLEWFREEACNAYDPHLHSTRHASCFTLRGLLHPQLSRETTLLVQALPEAAKPHQQRAACTLAQTRGAARPHVKLSVCSSLKANHSILSYSLSTVASGGLLCIHTISVIPYCLAQAGDW